MRMILAIMLALAPGLARAEVKASTESMFEIVLVETVSKPPAEVYAALKAPAKWWNSQHSWSGDAANMWMDAQAGGCFCEKLPDKGSVEHGRITMAQPGKMLRLAASLGPLQSEAVSAVLTWTLEPVDGGTKLTKSYIVSGHVRGGMAPLAPAVEQVLGQQLSGLKTYLEASAGS